MAQPGRAVGREPAGDGGPAVRDNRRMSKNPPAAATEFVRMDFPGAAGKLPCAGAAASIVF